MRKISRRTALTGLTGTGLATLLDPQPSRAQVGPPSPLETFVMGPFLLGERYRKMVEQGYGSPLMLRADPGPDKLIEWLNEFQLFLLDARDLRNPKKPRFAEGFPRLLAAGKVAFDWKDDKTEKLFLARVLALDASRESTDHTKPVPTCRSVLSIKLEFRGAAGLATAMSNFGMVEFIEYNLTGRVLALPA